MGVAEEAFQASLTKAIVQKQIFPFLPHSLDPLIPKSKRLTAKYLGGLQTNTTERKVV